MILDSPDNALASSENMRPKHDLPIDACWQSIDEYVESLLSFVSTSELFRNLCGGVHILDFLTRKPDLYSWVLPQEWRDWFEFVEVEDVLELLLREDLSKFDNVDIATSNERPPPPRSLVEYTRLIRNHSLKRDFQPRNGRHDSGKLPRHIAVGMKTKKVHEVAQFAAFVDNLALNLERTNTCTRPTSTDGHQPDSNLNRNIIDFGSGQNYLGRTLACPPYNKTVVAIEQRHHNVEGAKGMDISAKLAKKQKNIVNKKEWKQRWDAERSAHVSSPEQPGRLENASEAVTEAELEDLSSRIPDMFLHNKNPDSHETAHNETIGFGVKQSEEAILKEVETGPGDDQTQSLPGVTAEKAGRILYIEKELSSGDLSDLIDATSTPSMVVSIHSCGNLTHHGLRSISLNSSVKAVALVGCCYNLLTERLGPPTYKLPSLRSNHPRLEATSSAFDPHGFPMSKRLEDFTYPIASTHSHIQGANGINGDSKRYYNLNGNIQEIDATGKGVRLNITARMMAVQAPHNWGPKDSEEFFTRHYYRALLQRILLDLGVVKMSTPASTTDIEIAGGTLSGKDESGSPLIIGSLRKACFASFEAYVRGAVEKLVKDPVDGPDIKEKTDILFQDNGQLIGKYEKDYVHAKKHLSIIWSLMAFSANVVESTVLVDRYLWLKEQKVVEDAWVESVFDYKQSPRNMVVVGIKRKDA